MAIMDFVTPAGTSIDSKPLTNLQSSGGEAWSAVVSNLTNQWLKVEGCAHLVPPSSPFVPLSFTTSQTVARVSWPGAPPGNVPQPLDTTQQATISYSTEKGSASAPSASTNPPFDQNLLVKFTTTVNATTVKSVPLPTGVQSLLVVWGRTPNTDGSVTSPASIRVTNSDGSVEWGSFLQSGALAGSISDSVLLVPVSDRVDATARITVTETVGVSHTIYVVASYQVSATAATLQGSDIAITASVPSPTIASLSNISGGTFGGALVVQSSLTSVVVPSNTPWTIVLPQATAAGNLLCVAIFDSQSLVGAGLPGGWTQAYLTTSGVFNQMQQGAYLANNAGGITQLTFTQGISGGSPTVVFLEISGVVTVSPLDAASSVMTKSAASSLTGSVTTTNANDVIVAFFGLGPNGNQTAAWTPNSPWTGVQSAPWELVEAAAATAAGVQTAGAFIPLTTPYSVAIMAFKLVASPTASGTTANVGASGTASWTVALPAGATGLMITGTGSANRLSIVGGQSGTPWASQVFAQPGTTISLSSTVDGTLTFTVAAGATALAWTILVLYGSVVTTASSVVTTGLGHQSLCVFGVAGAGVGFTIPAATGAYTHIYSITVAFGAHPTSACSVTVTNVGATTTYWLGGLFDGTTAFPGHFPFNDGGLAPVGPNTALVISTGAAGAGVVGVLTVIFDYIAI